MAKIEFVYQKEEAKINEFVFVKDNWDDYGYRTLFKLYFKNVEIGYVRVCCPLNNVEDRKYIDVFNNYDIGQKIIENYKKGNLKIWTLAMFSGFYFKLERIVADKKEVTDFLNDVNDLTKNPSRLKDLMGAVGNEKTVISKSLFRTDNISQMYNLYQFVREEDKSEWNVLTNEKFFNWMRSAKEAKQLSAKKAERLIDKKIIQDDVYGFNIAGIIVTAILNRNKNILKNYINHDPFFTGSIMLNLVIKEKENFTTSVNKKWENFLNKIKNMFPQNTVLQQIINNITYEEKAKITDNNINKILSKILSSLRFDLNKVEPQTNLRLGQYTSLKTIKYVICPSANNTKIEFQKGNYIPTLRLTNANQMNDPMEGKVLQEYLKIKDSELKNQQQYSYYFISSASASLDSLPMWKEYGDQCKGVILIYSNEYLRRITSIPEVELYRMCYLDERNNSIIVSKFNNETVEDKEDCITKLLNKAKNAFQNMESEKKKKVLQDYRNLEYLFKNSTYSYENEFRILLNLEGKSSAEFVQNKSEKYPVPFVYANIKTGIKGTGLDNLPVKVDYSGMILGPLAIDVDYVAPYVLYCERDKEEKFKISRSGINFRE